MWEAERWDAILMDIHMPGMDGLEAGRVIRAREAAEGRARTPILAVTASVLTHETDALPGRRHGRLRGQADRQIFSLDAPEDDRVLA
jgi:CheY-like chemotaxis protein